MAIWGFVAKNGGLATCFQNASKLLWKCFQSAFKMPRNPPTTKFIPRFGHGSGTWFSRCPNRARNKESFGTGTFSGPSLNTVFSAGLIFLPVPNDSLFRPWFGHWSNRMAEPCLNRWMKCCIWRDPCEHFLTGSLLGGLNCTYPQASFR